MKRSPIKRVKKKTTKTKKPISLRALKKKADAFYSKWLRESAADENGYVKCYTCTTVKHFKEMQCGHYITRSVSSLRYYHKNTKPQCVGCNMFNEGRKDIYALNLVKEYGFSVLEELNEMKNQPPLKRDEIQGIIDNYR